MLLDFFVGNFLTFDEIQRFSMRAADGSDSKSNRIKGKDVLRASFIYGPNAAGKSNLVRAFLFSKTLITKGHVDYDSKIPITYLHRKSDGTVSKKPAYFEYLIEIGDTLYQYGLEVGDNQYIESEWLYKSVNGSQETLFSIQRPYDEVSQQVINQVLKKEYEEYRESSMNGSSKSLLQFCCKTNDDCKNLYVWFTSYLIINSFELPNVSMLIDLEKLSRMENDLKTLDTKISQFNYLDNDWDGLPELINYYLSWDDIDDSEFLTKSYRDLLKNNTDLAIVTSIDGDLTYNSLNPRFGDWQTDDWYYGLIEAVHGNGKNKTLQMETRYESTGTRRIIALCLIFNGLLEIPSFEPDVIPTPLDCDKTIIIDEIECSLHPLLVKEMVEKFLKGHDGDSQLIMTTHELCFLSSEPFYKDAYWFTDRKNNSFDESTELYSLLEFPDLEKKLYESAYESGQMGAIPNIRTIYEGDSQ